MFFETIAKFDTFQFICGTPKQQSMTLEHAYLEQQIPRIQKINKQIFTPQ